VSLTTSIQPHFQVERAADLPHHFGYALRIAGPLLALEVNSPLFPPDLYDDLDRETVLEDGWMENRIPVYEDMMNPPGEHQKVRFPADIEQPQRRRRPDRRGPCDRPGRDHGGRTVRRLVRSPPTQTR
jgi:hypothetical protein